MRQSIVRINTNFMQRGVLLLFALTAAIVSLTLMTTSPVGASAYGCTSRDPFFDPNLYCVYLSGGGTYVNYVSGSFRGGAVVCNYRITAEFFNKNWGWYETRTSSTTYGCANGGSKRIDIYGHKQTGYMCSTLSYDVPFKGRRSMSVCHRVNM